jgi:hypothetical protein
MRPSRLFGDRIRLQFPTESGRSAIGSVTLRMKIGMDIARLKGMTMKFGRVEGGL